MALLRRCVVANTGTDAILPRTVLMNREESLRQSVLAAAVSDMRTLDDRDEPVLNAEPRMRSWLAPVVGIFAEGTCEATPRSKVKEFVNREALNCELTAVDSLKNVPRGTLGTNELVEIQELAS